MNIFIFLFISIVSCKLRFVYEIFRHGARSPIGLDNYKDILGQKWSYGDGELTPIGMRQHYLLGYRNKKRYANYLSPSFDSKEVYIISTDVNRTIMSAYAHLQGMYPPNTGPVLYDNQTDNVPPFNDTDYYDIIRELANNSLPYRSQVFPIHVLGSSDNYYKLNDAAICKGVANILEKNMKKKSVIDFIDNYTIKYSHFLKSLYNISSIDHGIIWKVSDAFVAGYTERKYYPEMNQSFYNYFYNESLYALDDGLFDEMFDDENFYLGRMSMSPIVRRILEWMEVRIEYDKNGKGYETYKAPKMALFSSHDTYLSAMEAYLRAVFYLDKFIYTPFASSLFFELHKNHHKDEYEVLAIFDDIILLNTTYTDFKNKVIEGSVSNDEINTFCSFNEYSYFPISEIPYCIITIILSIICIVLIIIVITLCYKKTNGNTQIISTYHNII
jgi:hypothetical protein